MDDGTCGNGKIKEVTGRNRSDEPQTPHTKMHSRGTKSDGQGSLAEDPDGAGCLPFGIGRVLGDAVAGQHSYILGLKQSKLVWEEFGWDLLPALER